MKARNRYGIDMPLWLSWPFLYITLYLLPYQSTSVSEYELHLSRKFPSAQPSADKQVKQEEETTFILSEISEQVILDIASAQWLSLDMKTISGTSTSTP